MRLNYITCNSLIVSLCISGKKFAQTNYTVAVTVRCFGAFVTDDCCSDSFVCETFVFVTVAVTVVGKIDEF